MWWRWRWIRGVGACAGESLSPLVVVFEGDFGVVGRGAFQQWLRCCAQVLVEEGGDVVAGDLRGAVAVEVFAGQVAAELFEEAREVGERGVIGSCDGEPAPPAGEVGPAGVPGVVDATGAVCGGADEHEGSVEVVGERRGEGSVEVDACGDAGVVVQDLGGAGAAGGVAGHADPVRAQWCSAG